MQIQEGDGWRLQVDPERRPYSALLGGSDWAVELDTGELGALRRAIRTLLAQRDQLLAILMAEEELDLELDLSLPGLGREISSEGSLFVSLSGSLEQWSLRFVLTPADGSRAAEGAWSAAASQALAAALASLGDALDEAS